MREWKAGMGGAGMITIGAQHLFDGHMLSGDTVVTVEGDHIAAVDAADPSATAGCDYHAAWLTPGLIDIDSGIGLKEESLGVEGNDLERKHGRRHAGNAVARRSHPYDSSLAKALMGGVTTALVMPGGSNVVGGRGAVVHLAGATAAEMCVRAPFGVKFSLGNDPKQTHGQKRTPMTRMGNAFLVRDVLTRARDYKEKKKEYNMKYEALLPLLAGDDVAFIRALRSDDIMTHAPGRGIRAAVRRNGGLRCGPWWPNS